MAAAAKNLTPVVLELGGKNPAIVHSSANLRVAARRIAQGRWMNGGQVCLSPDYVLVLKDVKEQFLGYLKDAAAEFYGDPQRNPDYGRIVNAHHYDRLMDLLGSGDIYYSGEHDRDSLFVAPTILVNVAADSPIMQEEVFGPILPVLEADSVEAATDYVSARPRPLGLYAFAEDRGVVDRILGSTESGGDGQRLCDSDPTPELPFGGVGNSGMGKYHGELGLPRLHQRPRRHLPQHEARPECQVHRPYEPNGFVVSRVVWKGGAKKRESARAVNATLSGCDSERLEPSEGTKSALRCTLRAKSVTK